MVALGIVIAAASAVVIGAAYYGAMPAVAESSAPKRPMATVLIVEVLRSLAVAALVAGLLVTAEWEGVAAGVLLGLSLWTIPVVLLAGSVFHEGVSARRAALHAVDWLFKLVATGAIIGPFS
jgi:Protein of unknown function (DUF1761)